MNKSAFLFLVLFLAGAGSVVCQHAVTQAVYPNDVERTIVREYVYPATVSYVETSVEHYFAYADASMNVTNCEISHDLYVTDIVLHDKFAYFCGYNNISGTGVWGWFDINGLISNSLNYYIYDDFVCNVLYADSLFGLAVYEESGKLHIATVGSTTDGANKKYACLIDITGTEGVATGWNYQMGISECDFGYFNRMTTVCVTENYIVAAGPAEHSFKSEGYRFHLRGNPFMAGGPQDSLYTFPCVTSYYNSPDHKGEGMALTHTQGDTIASAVYNYSNNYSQNDGVLVNVYDIAQVLSVPWASPVYSKYIPAFSSSACDYAIKDLTYNRWEKHLILLLDGCPYNGMYAGSFVFKLPLPLPAAVNPVYLNNIYLTSLDNYNSQQSLIALGYDGNNLWRATCYTQPVSASPLCAVTQLFRTFDANYGAKTYHCSYTVCGGVFDCNKTPQAAELTIPLENICEQP